MFSRCVAGLALLLLGAAPSPYRVALAAMPPDAVFVVAVTQAGRDVPAQNPGKEAAVFDFLPALVPKAGVVTVPVRQAQAALAPVQFDLAAIYWYASGTPGRSDYVLLDCPLMRPGIVNQAVPFPVTFQETSFVAREALLGLQSLMSANGFTQATDGAAARLDAFFRSRLAVRACDGDRGGIFDPNATAGSQMGSEIGRQLGKLVFEEMRATL